MVTQCLEAVFKFFFRAAFENHQGNMQSQLWIFLTTAASAVVSDAAICLQLKSKLNLEPNAGATLMTWTIQTQSARNLVQELLSSAGMVARASAANIPVLPAKRLLMLSLTADIAWTSAAQTCQLLSQAASNLSVFRCQGVATYRR